MMPVLGACLVLTALAADSVMGPWVNGATPSGATVLWVGPADAGAACRVLPADGVQAAVPKVALRTEDITDRNEKLHAAVVTGLVPATQYRYQVVTGGTTVEGSFLTPPAVGSKEPFRFVFYGDPQTYPERHSQVVAAVMKELPFTFLALGGDYCEDSSKFEELRQEFFGPARDLLRCVPIWTVRGNHEMDGLLYRNLFVPPKGETYYSFDAGNLHYVVLDCYEDGGPKNRRGSQMQTMLKWLDADLAAAKADWIIVAYHEPTYNVAGRGSTWGREDVLPVLEKHEVDLVLSGHAHVYERVRPIGPAGRKPIIHITSGGGGGPSYSVSPSPIVVTNYSGLHYCVFEIEGNRLRMTARTPEGKDLDRFTLVKTGGTYQKEIMDTALTTDQAVPLAKVFKLQRAEFATMPEPGAEATATIQAGAFPEGWTVTLEKGSQCAWTVKPLTFEGGPQPVQLTVSPPAGVKAAATPWMGLFEPELTLRVRLARGGDSCEQDNVPVLIEATNLRQLVPVPADVSVPRAPRDIAVDGQPNDWQGVPLLETPSGPNRFLRLAWSEKGLLGCATVRDGGIATNRDKPAEGDGLELDFEMDTHRRLSVRHESRVLTMVLMPRGDGKAGAADVKIGHAGSGKQGIVARCSPTSDGYVLEFLIPADVLSPAKMAAGGKLGFHFVLRDGGRDVEHFVDTSRVHLDRTIPFFWGTLRLVEK
ncbi:MAG: metallophosphoesterase [Planctomycetes bacterium]|nr:metallophosphoesterase [Planctomycetota bacterium]